MDGSNEDMRKEYMLTKFWIDGHYIKVVAKVDFFFPILCFVCNVFCILRFVCIVFVLYIEL